VKPGFEARWNEAKAITLTRPRPRPGFMASRPRPCFGTRNNAERAYAIVRPSVSLFVTRMDQSKTVEVSIIQLSPQSSPAQSLYSFCGILGLIRRFWWVPPKRGGKQRWGAKTSYFLAIVSRDNKYAHEALFWLRQSVLGSKRQSETRWHRRPCSNRAIVVALQRYILSLTLII